MNLPTASGLFTRRTILSGGAATIASLAVLPAHADIVERIDLEAVFSAQKVAGTFATFEPAGNRFTLVNAERARRRYVPASTFKIANSLIALETGAVRDENEIVPYGGKKQPFPAWEKDMTMREAIAASAVPIYQELARRIGLEAYQDWLARLDFGNRAAGDNVETFWLDGPLEISTVEQAQFVARLARQELPASARAQNLVRDIVRLEQRDGRILYGKTGWRFSSKPQLGWWTGWIEQDETVTGFSLNIDMHSAADAAKRVALGRGLLDRLQVY
jgi:beta-lactamase class D